LHIKQLTTSARNAGIQLLRTPEDGAEKSQIPFALASPFAPEDFVVDFQSPYYQLFHLPDCEPERILPSTQMKTKSSR
jgi:hypothetical protein